MDALTNHGVRQVAVPAQARALCTLPRVDYADGFLVDIGAAQEYSAPDWVNAIFDGPPIAVKAKLLMGWSAIGLIPSLHRKRSVLGWEIRASTPEYVLLGRSSLIGMPGELLFKREQNGLLFATFVQHQNRIARTVWAATEPQHLPIVRGLLDHARRRLTR